MIIFFLIVLGIHLLVNLYIYIRGNRALKSTPRLRITFRWLMLFLTLSYPLGRYLEKVWIGPVSDVLHWSGALWFAGMLYAVMLLLGIDMVRMLNAVFHFLPATKTPPRIKLNLRTFYVVSILVIVIVTTGFLNAWHPRITRLTLDIPKQAGTRDSLRIVAATDIHMGTIIAKRKSSKLIKSINNQHPDIILFAGDLLDEDVQPVIRQDLGRCLQQLRAPLGVWAVTGNHEYIGGIDRTTEYLSKNGIALLRDTSMLIDNSFYLIGREDKDRNRFAGEPRKTVDELVQRLDTTKPLILLDHQPFELDEKAKAGIDLQISGHTHHGQLWPFGYLTDKIFEVSHGYKLKDQLHVYVSTGFGTWGPPVRVGNRPEIVVMDIRFR
ncbi:MAG: metallophosphoesterase [Marinilabiliaceae bacterium]|nr:metallophosphoesterase [Marinilabiliaceae bacterium]